MNGKTSHSKWAQRPQRPGPEVREESARLRRGRRAHRGFSLVELMVAVVISSLVLIAVIQVFLSNRESFRLQSNLGRMQENSRFAMGHLGRVVRLGGYWGTDRTEWVQGVLSAVLLGNDTPVSGTNGPGTNSDTITVAFRSVGDGFTRDCQGALRDDPTVTVTNQFSVNANFQLVCNVSINGVAVGPLPLVDGVDAMHVLYGLDTDADGSANQYVLPAGINFDNVVSVRIGLLLVTDEDALAVQVDNTNYLVLDATVHNGANLPGDRRLRRVLVRTIKLRNK